MNVTRYSEWYDQPENNPYLGRYQAIFTPFNADLVTLQPAAILTSAAGSDASKFAFVTLDDGGLVHVLHRVRQYGDLGDPPDWAVTAILGETADAGPLFVQFPGVAFHRTEQIPGVLTVEATNVAAEYFPDPQLQVAIDPPVRDTQEVRSRYVMLIPPHLVGQVTMATEVPEGLTPHDLWVNLVRPLMEEGGARLDCAPFIDWCRIAYTHGVGAENPLALRRPVPIALDPGLRQLRGALYRQDLPRRFMEAPVQAQELGPVVEALGAWREDDRRNAAEAAQLAENRAAAAIQREEARAAAAVAAAEEKPSKRWPEAWRRLLALCEVDTEENLPPLWLALAKTQPKNARATIQHFLDNANAQALGQNGRECVVPTCSGELAKQLNQLTFHTGTHNIDIGLSIFNISYPDAVVAASVAEAAGLYDQQMQSVGNLTLPETMRLKDAMAFKLPTSYFEVKQVCWCYHRLLAITLGFHHRVTRAFGRLAVRVVNHELGFRKEFDGDTRRCAGFLHSIYTEMYEWLVEVSYGEQPGTPDFEGIMKLVTRHQWLVPPLPANLLIPAPTATTERADRDVPREGADTRVIAPPEHLDRKRIPFQKDFKITAFVKAHGRPPKNDQGKDFCLGYHVRGSCYTNCRRLADHTKHTEAESSRLAEYLSSSAKEK